ncbi:MAG: thiamine pyrophosphate protein central region [Thermomicrobiales bacterium]|jgi:acetolactate synthase I/II/III large subunit|nr:thiamine pyrophosphate protein central region [Thermomicrobiales bacterium]MDF3041531.1 thiamine pyrophosphate protein central region [Thermomicrobiales bacterium]
MPEMTGWEAVVIAMKAEGVPYVFGLPGDPRHLYDALVAAEPDGGPRAIGVRFETSGAFMAMAYARVTNQLTACFGCPGPGIANLVPGILEAYSGCTPMLVLGVRASRQTYGRGAFQETDHLAMLSSITKWATTVEIPENIPWVMRRAIQLATSGQPGPVYVELPGDIGMGVSDIPAYTRSVPAPRPAADPAAIAAAAELIAGVKRPLLITGGGAILSGAGDAVADLSERFGIPIQTTPAGRGSVAETHPLFCGLTGLYRTTFPRRVYESADLLITVGSRMEEFQGGFLPYPEGAKLIQIDIEPYEFGRNWMPDVAIQADARLAIEALADVLAERAVTPNADYVAEITSDRETAIAAAARDAENALDMGDMPLKGKSIVHEINRVFGANTILVKENGGQDLWAYFWPYYQVFDPGCCVSPAEQTAMGYGVVGAMAAKLARPDRQVVCTTGDGAFQMQLHELGTAVQEQLPVTWVVLDDSAFGWVQWIQKRTEGPIVATQFAPDTDLVAAAQAAGIESIRVASALGLTPALEAAKRANADGRPFVVVVPVDQAHHHAEFDRFHGFEPAVDSATA